MTSASLRTAVTTEIRCMFAESHTTSGSTRHLFKKKTLSFILEWNQSRFSARVSYFEFEDVVICKVTPLNGVCPPAFSLGLLHYARLFNVERVKCEVHGFFLFY